MSTFKSSTTIARGVGAALTLVMVHYFVTSDAIRSGNAFLVPDLALTVLVLVSVLLPGRFAVPGMIFAYGWATAVYSVSLATYTVRGDFADGANHIALILPSLVMAGLLLRKVAQRLDNRQHGRSEEHPDADPRIGARAAAGR
ncbi:hypothetical protein [Micromonospora pisi]|nr:hypothetical protein [Micromonospora pisi]